MSGPDATEVASRPLPPFPALAAGAERMRSDKAARKSR